MKNLKLIAFVLAISISSISVAAPTMTDDPKSELREQIIDLLGDTNVAFSDNALEAEVVFTLNDQSEIVVVSVNCKNEILDGYIKRKLNYKKVRVSALYEGKIYHIPLKIVHK
jgi:hypothetical protein